MPADSPLIRLPEQYRQDLVSRGGEPASKWLAALPETVAQLCSRWNLQLESDEPRHGWSGVVFLARRDGEPCALKLSWSDADVAAECAALAAWAGRGTVCLLSSDPPAGAQLLECLDPGRTLDNLSPTDAATVAGRLIRELAVPADIDVATSLELLDGIRVTIERAKGAAPSVPVRVLDAALGMSADLAAMPTSNTLADIDLHYGNVLAATRRPWLAIDPKPVIGPPEMSVAELMWTRIDDIKAPDAVAPLFSAVVEAGALDADLAWAWTVVRTVNYWLWALSVGLTEDPRRCAQVLERV